MEHLLLGWWLVGRWSTSRWVGSQFSMVGGSVDHLSVGRWPTVGGRWVGGW